MITTEIKVTSFAEWVRRVKKEFPNRKRDDYIKHSEKPAGIRCVVADQITTEDTFMDVISFKDEDGYCIYRLKSKDVLQPLELLSDYVLAEDHVKGLRPSEKPLKKVREDVVPMGEGAEQYEKMREWGTLPEGIEDRIKDCAACGYPFIDKTKNRSAVTCCRECKKAHDRNNGRTRYNEREYGEADARYSDERRRQSLEYPFYSPVEMWSLPRIEMTSDRSVERALNKQILAERQMGFRSKPKWVTPYKGGMKSQRHDPRGNDTWRAINRIAKEAAEHPYEVAVERWNPDSIKRYLEEKYGNYRLNMEARKASEQKARL